MRHSRLLEMIWQGDVQPASGQGARRMHRALSALLPLRSIFVLTACGVEDSCILTDETELLAEVSLGDVLAEELSIDVPAGSLVVFSVADLLSEHVSDAAFSYNLGMLIAEALLDVVRTGVFPLSRETNALYAMASSYNDLIEGAGFLHLGLVPAQFRAGLAAGLCRYWTGGRTVRKDKSGLSMRPDFLTYPPLLEYLHQLDSNFTAPHHNADALMLFAGGPCDYGTWLCKVRNFVTAGLDAHAAEICEGTKQEEARVGESRKN